MRIFRRGRKEVAPETGLVLTTPEADKKQENEVRRMMAVPILHRAGVLAKRFSHLRAQLREGEEAETYTLEQIGNMLTSFVNEPGETGTKGSLKAIACLAALKGRGSVVTRTEMASVLWCHPEDEVRLAVVGLISGWRLTRRQVKLKLLERMAQYDNSDVVKLYASQKLEKIVA